MSTAAVKFTEHQETARFVASMANWRFAYWRGEVALFCEYLGARPLLSHVPEEVWRDRFGANDDAYSAVVEELERVD